MLHYWSESFYLYRILVHLRRKCQTRKRRIYIDRFIKGCNDELIDLYSCDSTRSICLK